MSAVRPIVLAVVVCGVAAPVQAEPISWPGWLAYIVDQTQPRTSANRMSAANRAASAPAPAPAPAPPPAPAPTPAPAAVTYQPPQPAATPSVVSPPVFANAPVNSNTGTITSPMIATSPVANAANQAPVDAFINLGNGPYAAQGAITTGNAQPWFTSAQVASVFGGTPTAQQQQAFDNTILQRVQQTFALSGVSVTLTDNPNVPALHTLSLVSGATASSLSSAIGMTQVGGNGFSFVDVSAPSANSVDQLEWIVAHNISHELMLAFGVGENYDKSGQYIDSRAASFAMMVNPDSTFSPAAAAAISQALASQNAAAMATQLDAQIFEAPAPEPATIAIWAIGALALAGARQIRSHRNRRAV